MFCGPCAPHQSDQLGPCILIVGVPTATARCMGPVSEPTNSAALRQSAASCIIVVGGAIWACPPLSDTIVSASGNSVFNPQAAQLDIPGASCGGRASAPYRSAGQIFDGQPAPGFSTAYRRPLSPFVSRN